MIIKKYVQLSQRRWNILLVRVKNLCGSREGDCDCDSTWTDAFFYCFSTYSNVNTCSSYPWISTVLNHSWQMLTINMNLTLRPERLHGVSLFNITPDLKSLCHMSQYPTKLWQNTIANQTSSKIYAWTLPINYQSINQSINRSSNQQIKQSKD